MKKKVVLIPFNYYISFNFLSFYGPNFRVTFFVCGLLGSVNKHLNK